MAKKQTHKKFSPLEKILTLSGIILVILGCLAGLYSGYANQRFIHEPLMVIMYFRLILLLGGGFLIGYLLNRKNSKSAALFNGVFYAVFATLLHELLYAVRFAMQTTSGDLPSPWGRIFFISIPVAALALTAALAYFTRQVGSQALNTLAKKLLIAAFLINQLYMFIRNLGAYASTESIWPMAVGYLLAPLTVAAIVYLLLPGIKQTVDRALYAVLIAAFYSILGNVIWEFGTDMPHTLTQWFMIAATFVTITLTGLLTWQVRKTTR